MPEVEEYKCPECGETITEGMKFCPGCEMELQWEDETEEMVDELLEDIEQPTAESESEAPAYDPSPPVEEPSPAEAEEAPEPVVEEPYEEPEPEPIAAAPVEKGGPLSKLGIAFIVLTIVAIVATLLAAKYDTWIQGASEESVGDRQQLFIYLGIVGIIVCAVIATFDMIRYRKKATA
jgi:hypothetical protein